MRYQNRASIFTVLFIATFSLGACGSSTSGSSQDSSTSGGTTTSGGTSTSGGTTTSGGSTTSGGTLNPADYTDGGSRSCETQSGHGSYVNRNCNDCHNGGMKPLSYAGSAPSGTTVTIFEDSTKVKYALTVNSQGNFCMRSKYGGDTEGGYTAMASVAMISHQTYGYCSLSGCHDNNMPIY
ncbi:MAG: hypothetical protein HQK86_14975 [Nitrospinae bacterium]|nr:hypothetical protein [Nitrospinota bacterium]MBF0633504.1 hypothetical protein [Nitrospinota bacterium]